MNNKIAFFDLDGTLIKGYTLLSFGKYLFKKKAIKIHILSAISLVKKGFENIEKNPMKVYKKLVFGDVIDLRKLDEKKIKDYIQEWFNENVPNIFRKDIVDLLKTHQKEGHYCVLITKSPDIIANLFHEYLKTDELVCPIIKFKDGKISGEIKNKEYFNNGKTYYVKKIANKKKIPLSECFAYTDSIGDLDMLETVENPICVYPKRGLRKKAQENNWSIVG